jgi:hypothetical protein
MHGSHENHLVVKATESGLASFRSQLNRFFAGNTRIPMNAYPGGTLSGQVHLGLFLIQQDTWNTSICPRGKRRTIIRVGKGKKLGLNKKLINYIVLD